MSVILVQKWVAEKDIQAVLEKEDFEALRIAKPEIFAWFEDKALAWAATNLKALDERQIDLLMTKDSIQAELDAIAVKIQELKTV